MALPEIGTDERDEIEKIRDDLKAHGWELAVTKETECWYAALLRDGVRGPASAPFAAGTTALDAALNAWRLFLSTPSLNSLNPSG